MIQKIHGWNNERRNCRVAQQEHFKSDHHIAVLDNDMRRLLEATCWHTHCQNFPRQNLKASFSSSDERALSAKTACVWNNKTTDQKKNNL